jgi:hypothetical protein
MGAVAIAASAITAGALASVGVVLAAVPPETATGLDIWTLVEKGGAPMAIVLLIALLEVVRRHDSKDRIIAAKDATILELSKRQTAAVETANEIANDQIKIARDTHDLLKELVILGRGKPDIG